MSETTKNEEQRTMELLKNSIPCNRCYSKRDAILSTVKASNQTPVDTIGGSLVGSVSFTATEKRLASLFRG